MDQWQSLGDRWWRIDINGELLVGSECSTRSCENPFTVKDGACLTVSRDESHTFCV
jgi:hypothetical protein